MCEIPLAIFTPIFEVGQGQLVIYYYHDMIWFAGIGCNRQPGDDGQCFEHNLGGRLCILKRGGDREHYIEGHQM